MTEHDDVITTRSAANDQRLPPMLHWCEASGTYLNIPVDHGPGGTRLGECPYCGAMLWESQGSEQAGR